ncbi:MAG: DKNYY domain-containing protein [Sphingobacterium sp.]|jgi:hypothetical protein|nr:DKNYY domain-containing protein [Sphingobacterium sp.]
MIKVFILDDKNIFYTDEQIPGADVSSFEVVDEKSNVSKDKNSYYYCSYRIPVKDYMTFEQIKGDYWKDKYHVYDISKAFYGQDCILTGMDPQTAKAVRDRNYIRDKNGKCP